MSGAASHLVLFVDDTDTSLAPLTAAYCRSLAQEYHLSRSVQIDSAGSHAGKATRSVPSDLLRFSIQQGLSLEAHRSRQLEAEHLQARTLVICMREDNFWFVRNLWTEELTGEVRMFSEWTTQLGMRELPEPLYGEVTYEKAFIWIRQCSRGLFDQIRHEREGREE
ncbi:MAG: hypothetical protein KDD64_00970 [Bdellovibrionales bacterium]|nr:hypothetical protein [Bdellovibrionales bacterium]